MALLQFYLAICSAQISFMHFLPKCLWTMKLDKNGDRRWAEEISSAGLHERSAPEVCLNLMDQMNAVGDGGAGKIVVHFASDCHLDVVHAKKLSDFERVKLWSYPQGGHNLVAYLKRSDLLKRLVLHDIVPEEAGLVSVEASS